MRGSEKILDDCDMFLMTSLCADPEATDEYLENYGYIRFIDKRGEGRIINQIYEFNRGNLRMIDTDLDPKNFEVNRENDKRKP